MNANELADGWEQNLKPHERHGNHAETMYWLEQYRLFGDKATTMLRQLQAENEALRKADLTQKSLCKAELTDEEIEEVIRKHWNREYKNRSMLEFAKAILRKAQEK